MYREIAERKEADGSEGAILAGVVLLEVADAVDQWFATHPEEPYGHADLLLDFDESDVVADAEHQWFNIPGNRERQEKKWASEYVSRLGAATTVLSEVGYTATGEASRSEMVFRLHATHPEIRGEPGLERVMEATSRWGADARFVTVGDGELIAVNYSACPPPGSFEPVVKNLVSIVS